MGKRSLKATCRPYPDHRPLSEVWGLPGAPAQVLIWVRGPAQGVSGLGGWNPPSLSFPF